VKVFICVVFVHDANAVETNVGVCGLAFQLDGFVWTTTLAVIAKDHFDLAAERAGAVRCWWVLASVH
jgi:hypothetical protein